MTFYSNKTTINLGPKKVGYGCSTYIIAEGGNNHQGNLEKAHQLVDIAVNGRADCIKFQLRDPTEAMSKLMREQPYDSPHSFGRTYGEHREAVELKKSHWSDIKASAESKGLQFTASPWDMKSYEFLTQEVGVDFVKVASGDNQNFPLLDRIAADKMIPVFSTGMMNEEDLKRSVQRLQKSGSIPGIVILACTSKYPCKDEILNVGTVAKYNQLFSNCVIGWSGHESDLLPTEVAVSLGASVVERHITFAQDAKGNDHRCSLLLKDLLTLRERCDRIVVVRGSGEKILQPGEAEEYRKLGKSLCTARSLKKGHVLEASDLVPKSPGTGIRPSRIDEIVGSVLEQDVEEDVTMTDQMVRLKNGKSKAPHCTTNGNASHSLPAEGGGGGGGCNEDEPQLHGRSLDRVLEDSNLRVSEIQA